jgi:MFS family permease
MWPLHSEGKLWAKTAALHMHHPARESYVAAKSALVFHMIAEHTKTAVNESVLLTVFIGVILASAFSAILVYAQELVPGNVGLMAGLFFGLAFGAAGIGSALLGRLADHTSIRYVFQLIAFFPLLGLLTAFLPEVEPARGKVARG